MTLMELLDKYNISLDKERDQYFLHNELIVDRMIEEADVSEEDTVLEIGAGVGSITEQLAENAGKVIAFENDERLIPVLEDRLEEYDNVEIIDRDVMHAQIPDFDKCVSNIPFHLSTEILELLSEYQPLSVLLVQDAFAEKMAARPGEDNYSRLTVKVNFHFTPVMIESVYDINFTPSPETDAMMVKLFPNKGKYDVEDEEFFFHTVRALFTHRKKKTRNAFYDSRHMFDLDKEEASDMQDYIPHSEERVENLNIKQFAEIADAINGLLRSR